jgi:hypothetical protein
MVDQSPSDAVLPEVRLDEKSVQLRAAVWAWHHRGKTSNDTLTFRDEDAALRDLFDGQLDRVRVREKCVAIAGIVERCAQL